MKKKFLEYELKQEIALTSKNYGNIPYYQINNIELNNLLKEMTGDELFQIDERILKEYQHNEDEITSIIIDHIQLLLFLKNAEDTKQKREKNEATEYWKK